MPLRSASSTPYLPGEWIAVYCASPINAKPRPMRIENIALLPGECSRRVTRLTMAKRGLSHKRWVLNLDTWEAGGHPPSDDTRGSFGHQKEKWFPRSEPKVTKACADFLSLYNSIPPLIR